MTAKSMSHHSSPSECPATGSGAIARARGVLDQKLGYVDHPSFDDPTARDAILAPLTESVGDRASRRLQPPARLAPLSAGRSGVRLLSREQEAHLFRRMNYLKYRANQLKEQL